jgi:hypothetical protein
MRLNLPQKVNPLLAFLALSTVESLIPVLFIDWTPSEQQNAVLFGFSFQRLASIGLTVGLFILFAAGLLTLVVSGRLRGRLVRWFDLVLIEKDWLPEVAAASLFLFAFFTGLLILFHSNLAERFGMLLLVYYRFQALYLWVVAFFGQLLLYLSTAYPPVFWGEKWKDPQRRVRLSMAWLVTSAAALLLFFLVLRYFSLQVFYIFDTLAILATAVLFFSVWLFQNHRDKAWYREVSTYLKSLVVFLAVFMAYRLATLYVNAPNTPGKAYFNLLADAWLRGVLYLPNPDQTHDLTLYLGHWYVANPPLPAIFMVPLVYWMGVDNLNTVIFSLFFAALNTALMFLILEALSSRGWTKLSTSGNLWLTTLFAFGTAHFYIGMVGKMWFLSNMTSITCMALAVLAAVKIGSPWLSGAALGMAVLARPNLAFLWPFLIGITLQIMLDRFGKINWGKAVYWAAASAVPVIAGVVFLLLYNQIRFGNFFDFGYMTENVADFMAVDLKMYGTFHPHFILRNLNVSLLLMPHWSSDCGQITPSLDGMSMFLATPALIYLFKGFRRKLWVVGAWVSVGLLYLLLLMYYNTGAWQFGYKYLLDFLIPVSAILAVSAGERVSWKLKGWILISIAVNWIGVLWWFGFYCR